ncbi:hypothetical protein AWJ20_4142 [Sugiyamaella lignohabitans]|uniref:Tag1 C-terminal domain-containing protein n=1 Tax=Sugiyamaella lignohabitans TaxID=796027 RepID=A0A161HH53_9ASCO|nr:uncharacterized protein AWJ20_4142 [Sugiyamaella lignohabitans]ANB11337.1 hypothetical protein AWJ20_4142 [Sugiyamaella lignohabitans]
MSAGGSGQDPGLSSDDSRSNYTESHGRKDKGKMASRSGEREPLLPRYEDQIASAAAELNQSTPPGSASYGTTAPQGMSPSTSIQESDDRMLWSITKSTFSKLATVFIFLAFGFMILYLLQINSLREEIVRVPQLNIHQVSLDSLDGDGINVQVTGFVQVDYDKGLQGSQFRKSIIKGVSGLIGSIDAGEQNITLYFDQNYNILRSSHNHNSRISDNVENYKINDDDGGDDDDENPFVHTANITVPSLTVDTHHLHNTSFDFVAKIKDFGSPIVIGTIAQHLLANDAMHFKAHTRLPVSKWGWNFGTYDIDFDQIINEDDQDGDNEKPKGLLNVQLEDIKIVPSKNLGLDVITKLSTDYKFSAAADIPSLLWELKIPGCPKPQSSPYQLASKGRTYPIHLLPQSVVGITVESNLAEIPFEILFPCDNGPSTNGSNFKSPLDMFIQKYISGETNLVKIEGSSQQDDSLPDWLSRIIQSVSFTIPFEGKKGSDDLIQGLEFRNFRLSFPPSQPFPPVYAPNQPPRVSATIRVHVKTPNLIDIDPDMDLSVPLTKGSADLFSQGEHFAHIDIDDWIPCTTEHDEGPNTYLVEFDIESVPVEVIDQSVFGRVMREVLIAGGSPIRVEAVVDAEVSTPIGDLVVTDLPAQGDTVIRSSGF